MNKGIAKIWFLCVHVLLYEKCKWWWQGRKSKLLITMSTPKWRNVNFVVWLDAIFAFRVIFFPHLYISGPIISISKPNNRHDIASNDRNLKYDMEKSVGLNKFSWPGAILETIRIIVAHTSEELIRIYTMNLNFALLIVLIIMKSRL